MSVSESGVSAAPSAELASYDPRNAPVSAAEQRERAARAWLPTLTTVLVHAVAAGVAAWPLALGESVASAALGAAFGVLGAHMATGTRLRTPVLLGGAALTIAVGVALRSLVVGGETLPEQLGPADASRLGDALLFFFGWAGLSFGLRTLSIRHRALTALEVLLVAFAFAQLVIAHRNGAINRPFEIADAILSAGGDPTDFFLWIGGAATVVVVLLLVRERSPFRALLHLAILGVVFWALQATTDILRPPPPDPAAGLGPGESDSDDESDAQEDQGGGGGRGRDEDLEFESEDSSQNQRYPVGIVLFHADVSSPTGTYYFRQSAFSQYNGVKLVRATRTDADRDLAESFPVGVLEVAEPPPTTRRDADGNEVPNGRVPLETTVALLAEHARPFAITSPERFTATRNPHPDRFRRTYRVRSQVMSADLPELLGTPVGDRSWQPELLAHYTQGPEDPRFRELAERIVAEKLPPGYQGDSVAQLWAITEWLGEHGSYSLRNDHAGADDPTADFLFGDLTGYCVHFAHAAVFLVRSLGIPARVGTGYAIPEANREGGSALLVMGDSSHAWPEVYVQGYGWVVADVAPATVLTPPGPPPDADLQRLLAELARGLEPLPVEEAEEAADLVRGWQTFRAGLRVALLFALVLGLVLLVGGKLWVRLAPRFLRGDALARAVYRAGLDALAGVALRRELGESREAFARRVGRAAPSFARLTQAHLGVAFGSRRRLSDVELRAALADVRRELRGDLPFWRRALGALSPWTWLLAR